MPPEVQNALYLFLITVIGVATAGVAGIGLVLKASFEHRAKEIAADLEQKRIEREDSLKQEQLDREQKRQIELEEMRQKTATAQAAADQAQAVGENLVTMNATMIRLIESHTAVNHAYQVTISNLAQSSGDVIEGIEKMGQKVSDAAAATRATGGKVDTLAATVERLYGRFMNEFPIENTVTTAFQAFKNTLLEEMDRRRLLPLTSNGQATVQNNGQESD